MVCADVDLCRIVVDKCKKSFMDYPEVELDHNGSVGVGIAAVVVVQPVRDPPAQEAEAALHASTARENGVAHQARVRQQLQAGRGRHGHVTQAAVEGRN